MKEDIGYLGEVWVQLELARRGFYVSRVYGLGVDFIGENGVRIEVKSALPSKNRAIKKGKIYEYVHWQFRVTTELQKSADYFVCVPFSAEKVPLGFFVFPRKEFTTLGKSNMITIFESDLRGLFKFRNKKNKHKFLNNWDLILRYDRFS